MSTEYKIKDIAKHKARHKAGLCKTYGCVTSVYNSFIINN
jgi:hypothetical protein